MLVHLTPAPLRGSIAAPPSKSMSHRAVLCAALCRGNSMISGLGKSRDIEATLDAIKQLCGTVSETKDGINIFGRGGFCTITRPVDCGESGSTLRFLIPLFSLTQQKIQFVGGGRLFARPQTIYEKLFHAQGLLFEQDESGITISGALQAGEYSVPGNVSSQFISGLLFMMPLLDHESSLTITGNFESASYVELTLATLRDFGITIKRPRYNQFIIPGKQNYIPCPYTVEGDYSQAAFLAVLGALVGDITVTNLRPDTKQGDAAILDILARCGAQFTRNGNDVTFAKSALTATEIDLADCPDLGPVLTVLGACCEGVTTIKNAGRLRIKESDRIFAMESELRKFGVDITSTEDTITITGGALQTPTEPLAAHNDHRVVMSLAVLALGKGIAVDLTDAQAVAKSWPTFFIDLATLGADVSANA
ncbi:MAG: 3-phosphoshikimate 1-carboxyvinyltransferase [Faecalibacterium sp.]